MKRINHLPGRLAMAALALPLVFSALAPAQEAKPASDEKPRAVRYDSRMPHIHHVDLMDEKGEKITPPPEPKPLPPGTQPTAAPKKVVDKTQPYSTATTCGKCHDYPSISSGWHFNANKGGPAGRPGEPWILVDPTTRTQLPLSYRGWTGTYKPSDIGMTEWQFTLMFGRHMPGGGVGETKPTTQPSETNRWGATGPLQIDCLVCHSADASHDPAVRAGQIAKQNFRWAPTAAALGAVSGSAKDLDDDYAPPSGPNAAPDPRTPKTKYDVHFNDDKQVHLAVTKTPSPDRCYFCHTANPAYSPDKPTWHGDADIHIRAGFKCADCHRNGIDHGIVRGYESEGADRKDSAVSSFSCRGCHYGVEGATSATLAHGGRLGAPHPAHKGLPPVHLEKIACTTCHAGPWPQDQPQAYHTAFAHALGTGSNTRHEDTPPKIVEPVFLRGADGKIAPHRMTWPNFWGRLSGDRVTPLDPETVKGAAGEILPELKTLGLDKPTTKGYPKAAKPLTDDQILKTLAELAKGKNAGEPVYISGGKMYRRSQDGKTLSAADHEAAKPYAWPFAHDVRPAAQALGAGGCGDCHSTNSPVFFGNVAAVGPLKPEAAVVKTMYELRGDNGLVARTFAQSFIFRPMLKVISFACCAIIAAVLLLYGLRGLGVVLSRNNND